MKISELIHRLRELRKVGDVEVVHSGQCGGETYDVEEVRFDLDDNQVHIY